MKSIKVTGCLGCPFLGWDESIIGYWCKASEIKAVFFEDEHLEAGKKPYLCPLVKSDVTVTLS